MHLPTLALTTLLTLATASPPSKLTKRCSPPRDPDLPHGYYPPAPCWQSFDTACKPHLSADTTMTLDAEHGLAVVYGVSSYCAAEIAEEQARDADGRKNYGWEEQHGRMTVIEPSGAVAERILVLSGMSALAVQKYAALTYQNFPSGN
jgi:hypothetical protein